MYIVFAILAFGLIIAVHEIGHFLAAKALNVKVLELSIGMGPKILSKQGKETLYSLRLVPFGGFCSMEGEYGEQLEDDDRKNTNKKGKDIAHTDLLLAEGVPLDFEQPERPEPKEIWHKPLTGETQSEEEPDPRSFIAQKSWRRVVILAAGSVSNIIIAFIILLLLSAGAEGFGSTVIADVHDGLPDIGVSEILPGDKIIAINGERLYYFNDYNLFMSLNADKPVTITLLRDGQYVDYQRRSYEVDGAYVYRYGLSFAVIEPTVWETVKYTAYQSYNFIRMIRVSVAMMISGAASVKDVAGPVGIVSAMNEVGQESATVMDGITNIIYFTAFIGVNVAIINLLPIPAMDGGRILFVAITWVIEKTTKKKLDPKYENYINTGAFALLIGLMVIIMFNDVMRIINS